MATPKISTVHAAARRVLQAIDAVEADDPTLIEFLENTREAAEEALHMEDYEPIDGLEAADEYSEGLLDEYPELEEAYNEFFELAGGESDEEEEDDEEDDEDYLDEDEDEDFDDEDEDEDEEEEEEDDER